MQLTPNHAPPLRLTVSENLSPHLQLSRDLILLRPKPPSSKNLAASFL